MRARWLVLLMLTGVLSIGHGEEPMLPQGLIPGPEEPGIAVTLRTDKDTYAPGERLQVQFTLSQDAYVYLYDVRPGGKATLLVPNRFLQDPRFPGGEHVLPTSGWVLRVTEPEGMEYLELIATDQPLPFYEAKAFEEVPFLSFTDPAAFAHHLRELVMGSWGAAWTRFRVYRPKATLRVDTDPPGAAVWASGNYLGPSPLAATVAPGRVILRVEKEGYQARTVDLTVADGEEVELTVILARAPSKPEPLWPPSDAAPRPGLGVAVGLGSLAVEAWGDVLGFGISLRAPPRRPDLTLPGPGGLIPWGPEVEAYLAGWFSVGRGGFLLLAGLSLQEMAWIPEWTPPGALPLVDIEPETEVAVRSTWGVGLGPAAEGWRAYLAWHSRRGPLLGFILVF
ncbi:DUF4384 domain-containing protein [Candidatus Bipolaricaulota bacterium]|nr:DUF4384 domain-containing protein [Candidatus Bipolaricaulota bacterium]